MRKRTDVLEGLGKYPENQLLVQKSLPLLSLWHSEMTLSEFKILDTYLSRIDSHHPESRIVIFEKGEFEKLLNVERIKTDNLKVHLSHLLGNSVEIYDNTVKEGFVLITLFNMAKAEKDENSLWKISLECSEKAMKYFFNVEDLGYLRYKLRCTMSLESLYSYTLFLYLEHNRFRKSWEIPLDELKTILNCDKEKIYKEFKYFNDEILKKVQKELKEKTQCLFSYEKIRTGRRITDIRFIMDNPDFPDSFNIESQEDKTNSISSLEIKTIADLKKRTDIKLISDVCRKEFSEAELELIYNEVCKKGHLPRIKDPENNVDILRKKEYVSKMYLKMDVISKRKKIENRCFYLVKMIENDFETL